jgi:hypothetical protein
MVIHLKVQAEVVDIKKDTPHPNDIFLIDTNIWLWQTYPNAGTSWEHAPNKIFEYGAYLKAARQNGAMLAYSGLTFAELAHVIEKTECNIYNERKKRSLQSKGLIAKDSSIKEYRHNLPDERSKVVSLVHSAWMQVKGLAVPVNLTIDDSTTNAALSRFQSQALDGYDLFILESISKADPGQVKIITDDIDYAVVPDIQVFTSNPTAVKEAARQGKLLTR